MTTFQFELPCPGCAKPHVITVAQAGETIACDCGASFPAPSLREIRRLEPVSETTVAAASSPWHLGQGILFVLGCLLIAGAGLATWRLEPVRQTLNTQRPEFPELNFDVQSLTPPQAWDAWKHFRGQKLDFRETPRYVASRARYRELSMYLYAAWAGAGVGALMVALSLLWPKFAAR